jgi:hypothetical protein
VSLSLPKPLGLYFASEATNATNAIAECFAPDATVHFRNRTYSGLAEIKAWKRDGKRLTEYQVEIGRVSERAGRVIVAATVTGNFPESPAEIEYAFVLANGRIAIMDIREGPENVAAG